MTLFLEHCVNPYMQFYSLKARIRRILVHERRFLLYLFKKCNTKSNNALCLFSHISAYLFQFICMTHKFLDRGTQISKGHFFLLLLLLLSFSQIWSKSLYFSTSIIFLHEKLQPPWCRGKHSWLWIQRSPVRIRSPPIIFFFPFNYFH